jgi:hypothetical protein
MMHRSLEWMGIGDPVRAGLCPAAAIQAAAGSSQMKNGAVSLPKVAGRFARIPIAG